MILTPELKDRGRRNFLRAIAGVPALTVATAAAIRGEGAGEPVKAALIGPGGEGRVLLGRCHKDFINIKAICDINPRNLALGSEAVLKLGMEKPREYADWHELLLKEDVEAVLIATPLWTHAEIAAGCLEAKKHVLCEKMMARDVAGCKRMLEASQKNDRLLEIGYQRFYSPMYQAAYDKVIKTGAIGEIYHARLAWHRNASWRRGDQPPSPDYDASKWGYPTWDHLLNWRLYKKYSAGLMAELASHQLAATDWFFDSAPHAVYASGGIHRYKDGREVNDHIYATFEYPGGRTVTFSSIQSNKFDHYYEMFMGTKGALILRGESEAYLFGENDDKTLNFEVTKQSAAPVADASETRRADEKSRTVSPNTEKVGDQRSSYQYEIAEFCAAIRNRTRLRCGGETALKSAAACLAANESAEKKTRIEISYSGG